MGTYSERAVALFDQGYGCASSVSGAFAEAYGMREEDVLKLAEGLGGGVARMREVCGAVTGMAIAVSMAEGTGEVPSREEKGMLYAHVQRLADAFREENGSILCGVLIGQERNGAMPAERNDAFGTRPCRNLVRCAAELVEEYLAGKTNQPPSATPFPESCGQGAFSRWRGC